MAHNKCLRYSLFWAATATAPISTCNLDAIITSVDSENLPEPESTCINYGYLYNWYALNDSRNICAPGWHLFTPTERNQLLSDLGGTSVAGGAMKVTGTSYWTTPNTGATNSSGLNVRGGGRRSNTGGFGDLGINIYIWSYAPASSVVLRCQYNTSVADTVLNNYKDGAYVRLIKDSTTLNDGETGTYTGNDGKVYNTVCISGVEYLSDNLAETKYRNGDTIPKITDNTTWAGLTTGAICAYDNDESNAICSDVIIVPDPEVPENCDIFVPQGFSPSNNDGINDYFRVQNLDCYPVHKMSIFDRNGTLLYTRTNNYDDEPWDGKVGGIIVSGVTRTWVLEINGAIHSTGSVYVI